LLQREELWNVNETMRLDAKPTCMGVMVTSYLTFTVA